MRSEDSSSLSRPGFFAVGKGRLERRSSDQVQDDNPTGSKPHFEARSVLCTQGAANQDAKDQRYGIFFNV